ncbi:hypothetical protein ACFVY4_32540 [Streptomyces sp. NPDC058299]|uniref:hypothetical protein n=1 Tax=Streptomyces sp. NPDC058299 TaxID=3346435 RepID=UPI0036E893A6
MDAQLLDRVGEAVLEWAVEWGEQEARNVLMVVTTHEAATQWLHGPQTWSRPDRVYFATVQGTFQQRGRSGEWAALFVDPITFRVVTFTVRPLEAVPNRPLGQLGTVHRL